MSKHDLTTTTNLLVTNDHNSLTSSPSSSSIVVHNNKKSSTSNSIHTTIITMVENRNKDNYPFDDINMPLMQDWIAFKTDLFKNVDIQNNNNNNTLPSTSAIKKYSTSRMPSKPSLVRKQIIKNNNITANNKFNLASTNRAKFLVGFNRIDNIVAITYLEESRRVTHDRPTSLAASFKLVFCLILFNF